MPGVKGRSGRRPIPPNVRLVSGAKMSSKQKSEVTAAAAEAARVPVASAIPKPPTHWAKQTLEHKPRTMVPLYKYASEYWQTKAAVLFPLGLLTNADLTAFEMCSMAYGEWRDALDECNKGMYVQDPTKPINTPDGEPQRFAGMKNPYYALADRAQKRLQRLEIEFGMTPSSRSKVSLSPRMPASGSGDDGAGAPAGSTGGKFAQFLPSIVRQR